MYLNVHILFFLSIVNKKFESKLNKLVRLDDIFSEDLNIANLTLEFMSDSDIKQIENIL